ncbi:deoxyribodipyrimidine photo-lyase [Pseudolysinimonas sp.]|uniref:cryptochrome/photolyase family protein n=1 Tax=Pseudolysinimonas sp. TaxID=2680009 RepID=UPI00286A4EB0|nr:deoxyribodipyrimidine photo-lyase [Pseudolysinimonas sp.]
MSAPSIVWFRDDLRLSDHPALSAALGRGRPVVLLYLFDEESAGIRPLGGATRWWLHHSLAAHAAEIARLGGRLVLRRGAAEEELPRLVAEAGADAVFWNRRYGAGREVDARLKAVLRDAGVEVASFAANLLVEPWEVTTGAGTPYQVFTPFWRAARERPMREPLPAPRDLPSVPGVASDDLDSWKLLPTRPDWAAGLRETWEPGENSASRRVERFAAEGLADYHRRDEPSVGTSGLSPHLRFGEISPAQIWHRMHGNLTPAARRNVPKFLSELGWRDFHWSILYAHPDLATRNYRAAYDEFPWVWDHGPAVAAWRQGRTGIPLVDAGMRELMSTGTMHNRVRMVVASFLVKNLLRHWRLGEEWFWDTLVDADEASNPGNWQWVAGSGADAAPYFRVFNPDLQAKKFDPDGEYLRRWVPAEEQLAPIVDLAESRREALEAFSTLRR